MEKILARQIPKIKRGMTKIAMPGEGRETTFAYPAAGPDTYQTVGKRILESRQKLPTGEQTVSLVHSAYCVPELENEPEFNTIREIMRCNWLWVFNRTLWTPKGVYVVQDSEAIGRSQPLNQTDLEKMLKGGKEVKGIRFSKDERVRFAPRGLYKLGEHTPESLAKDGFLIAGYGLEGAKKLGEVSTKFKYSPRTFGIDVQEGQNSEQRLSALGGYRGVDADGLNVYGDCFAGDRDGHAFGVLK